MSNDEKRANKIIEAANQAISKMTDPIIRNAAKVKVALVQKKFSEAGRQPGTTATRAQQLRDREVGFDR